MRSLIIAVLLVLVLVLVGWVSFHYSGHRASVTLETERIEQDTSRLIDEGREAVRDVRERAAEVREPEAPDARQP
jgi:hypothetical protein